MEKFDTTTGEEANIINGELPTLFRVLSNPDTLKILYHTGMGIENSTYAMEVLDLTPKRYYSRLKELIDSGLVRKKDDVYRQTALGRMVYDRFLPAMGRAVDAREEMELIVYLEETELDSGVRKLIEDKLDIPRFAESNKLSVIDNYESGVVELIDQIDDAKERILLASNHVDVRVIEAIVRSVNRGVSFRLIMGKDCVESNLQKLKFMLSARFAKAIIEFMSIPEDLGDLMRVADIPYSFCVIDDSHSIYELEKPFGDDFLLALFIDEQRLTKILADSFNRLWEVGEPNKMFNFLESLKRS